MKTIKTSTKNTCNSLGIKWVFFSERIGHKSTKNQIMTELKASKTFLRNHRF